MHNFQNSTKKSLLIEAVMLLGAGIQKRSGIRQAKLWLVMKHPSSRVVVGDLDYWGAVKKTRTASWQLSFRLWKMKVVWKLGLLYVPILAALAGSNTQKCASKFTSDMWVISVKKWTHPYFYLAAIRNDAAGKWNMSHCTTLTR